MSTDNIHPTIAGAIAPFIAPPLVYVEPNPKRKLEELLMNPPMSVLTADSKAIFWLDALKREAFKIK
jgi:hypothetical protein